jgi:hypothetical protein
MDTVFPSTPEKIYNLMFESGFAKTFMSEDQKLMGKSAHRSELAHAREANHLC